MVGSDGGKSFSEFFAEGQYQTQAETLEVKPSSKELIIGVPKESTLSENRVAIVPNSIRTLVGYGFKVIVERGAGEASHFTDHQFSEAGAEVTSDRKKIFGASIVIKVSPPTEAELELFTLNQTLISPLHIPTLTENYISLLKKKKVNAFAMEYLRSSDGTYPIVRIMSEIAGMSIIQTASELLSSSNGGRGVLLGGVSGVPPAKVIILGAGVVGEFATKAALGLGASVRVFDNDVSKLMRIQKLVGQSLHTSTFNPVYLGYQMMSADVVIGAVHSSTGRAPILVTEEMVTKMKPGSVIIDVSIDQGGCIETSEMTTLESPTFIKHDVIHFCVPNIPSKVPRTASVAISNITTGILIKIGKAKTIENLIYNNEGLRNGIYTFKGCLTNEYVASRFGLKYTSINLLMASHF